MTLSCRFSVFLINKNKYVKISVIECFVNIYSFYITRVHLLLTVTSYEFHIVVWPNSMQLEQLLEVSYFCCCFV